MSKRNIHITSQDMRRLGKLLRSTSDPFGHDRPYLDALRTALGNAKIVDARSIDGDVVTMNSTVRVRHRDSDEITLITLVFPEHASFETNHISVIAPMGAALLGYRVGDRITYKLPRGQAQCEILEVLYQPEAAGDLHL
jgi:regulator of nucleoside diphosphate kinase